MTTMIGNRLDYLAPPTCPWCGRTEKIFVRVEGELVCRSPHFPRHRYGPESDGTKRTQRTAGPALVAS